ncbi:MAG: 6-hydroxynicotinate reductase, partial [Mesorhizobium sp.]
TMRRDDYVRLGGYEDEIRSVEDILAKGGEYLNPRSNAGAPAGNPWPPLAQLRRIPANGAD